MSGPLVKTRVRLVGRKKAYKTEVFEVFCFVLATSLLADIVAFRTRK